MADPRANLVIGIQDLASSGLKKLNGALESLRDRYLHIKEMVTDVVAVFDSFLTAAAEQEAAEHRLALALKNQGDATKETRESLVNYAAELQKTTTFSDDALIENQALLVSFGLLGDELKGGLQAAMDLSIARNMDLATAAMLVGKAYQGNTETLKRYGIEISSTLPQGERFQAVLDAINGSFGGSAQAATQTYAGRVANLKLAFGELTESIGGLLMRPAENWVLFLKESVGWIQKQIDKIKELTGARETEADQLEKRIKSLTRLNLILESEAKQMDAIKNIGALRATQESQEYRDRERAIAGLKARLEELRALENAPGGPKGRPTEPVDEEGAKLAEQVRQQMEVAQAHEVWKENIQAEHLARRLEAHNQFRLAQEVRDEANARTQADIAARAAKEDEAIQKRRIASTMSGLSMLASFQTAKTKELAQVAKAAAMATTIINAHKAAGEAMAAFAAIPPLAIAMGALMEAAGMAQAAQIAGVPLATGGMVLPTQGGTLATIGEAGGREAVLPLDNPASMEAIREALGGAGGGITIQAGVIVADDVSLEELARRIDAKLYTLRRNRGSAFGD